MRLKPMKHTLYTIALSLCFIGTPVLAQNSKPSPVTPAVLQEIEQLSPIGTATIVDAKTAITHAWFIDSSRGQVIVCNAIANLQMGCAKVGPPLIPLPAPPGIRYRGLGVSSVVANNTALTQAWYVDQVSMQVYVCEAISNLQGARCVKTSVPR